MMRQVTRFLFSLLFIAAGFAHFFTPAPFVLIVPPFLSQPIFWVYLSGFFEVLGGMGLFFDSCRKSSAWGLIALLLAVFPANLYMAVERIKFGNFPSQDWMFWARLPLQFVFVGLIAWSCNLTFRDEAA